MTGYHFPSPVTSRKRNRTLRYVLPPRRQLFFIFLLPLLLSRTPLGYWPTAAVTVSVFIVKYRHKVGCWVCRSSNGANCLIYDKLLRGLHSPRGCRVIRPAVKELAAPALIAGLHAGSLVWVASVPAGHSFFSGIRFFSFHLQHKQHVVHTNKLISGPGDGLRNSHSQTKPDAFWLKKKERQ